MEAALKRKNWMPELADEDIPVVGASRMNANVYAKVKEVGRGER